jgi:DNA-binding NtrC family response regulator
MRDFSQKKCVLVHRSEASVDMLSAHLKQLFGCRVIFSDHFEEALSLVRKEKVDLVITSTLGSKEAGIDLLKKMRVSQQNVPFIVMTDKSCEELDALRDYDAISVEYRPMDWERLTLITKNFLSTSAYVSRSAKTYPL